MSTIPDLPLALVRDLAPLFGLKFTEHPQGCMFARGDDRYRLIPFEDHVRGSQLREACHVFGIDPYDFVNGTPPGAAHA